MGLSLYKQKRNFKNTPEPTDSFKKQSNKLSFVVQRHAASHLHYDFRLEMGGVLKSWAVPKGPSMKAGERRLAVMVEDHPLSYGKFYGEIPEGNYGAGVVEIWDEGTYAPADLKQANAEKSLSAQLKKGHIAIDLKGKHLKGSFSLIRLDDGKEKNWLLIKKKDEYAQSVYAINTIDPVRAYPSNSKVVSVKKTKMTKRKDEVENLPRAWPVLKKPMLAKLTDQIDSNAKWLYEVKYDGYRAITKIVKGKVEMLSRNGNHLTKLYSSLVSELEQVKEEMVLDGEVVVENSGGISDFQLLQNYSITKQGTLKYYVFDLLFLNGHRTIDLPLEQRQELLKMVLGGYRFKNIIQSETLSGKGPQLLKKFASKGYEGIMAKDPQSLYIPGHRTNDWLKMKSVKMQEAVIAGYTLPRNSRKYFGSLILGLYEDKALVYIGNCGTGFTDVSLRELHGRMQKLETSVCPFKTRPLMTGQKGKAVWLKPSLVCNVKFHEWTQDNHMRAPVFMGLRDDKKARDVLPEGRIVKDEAKDILVIGKKKVRLSNIDKIYWPVEEITKGDLIQYYNNISDYILPYLKNRPQSLNRFPNGIKGQSFFQKDMDIKQLPDWARTVKLYSKSNKGYIHYLLCNDRATLLYMANLGCIEINPWHSKYTKPDYPDYMIMDLDPGKIAFTKVVDTALVIKDICDELRLPCYCKTSGASGLHIYLPLKAKYHYDEVKIFAELLAGLAHKRLPDITSIERPVAKRRNKVYIDFLQNRAGQTVAAPYSVRPRLGATVSAPLLWKEVNHKLSPEMFTIHNMRSRLDKVGDLWEGVLAAGISIPKVLRQISKTS